MTAWEYDPATGRRPAKRYADGSTVTYTYTPDTLPLRTTYPSGRWLENAYDENRRLVGVTHSDPLLDFSIARDAFGRATNVVGATGREWRYEYGIEDTLLREETVAAGCGVFPASQMTSVLVHFFDAYARPTGHSLSVDGVAKGGVGYSYGEDGLVSGVSITNAEGRVFSVAYSNIAARCHGYVIMTPGGATIRRVAARNTYRRDLLDSCTTMFNGSVVDSHAYTYDDLSRPTARTSGGVASSFAYNDRSEIVSAQIGTNLFTHAYDYIGNQTLYAANAETNAYTHNALNQISTATLPSLCALDSPLSISHDDDGNLVNDSVFAYSYDSENHLASVASNGVVLVSNKYDYRGRRIRKTTPTAETTFVYDGWNVIHENVCEINGATTNTTEIQYFWGIDISETYQGAGGVGGLLATAIDGQFYFPTYDNNGNVTKYIDESGNVVASYEYDDFGRTISQSGTLADFFHVRFSTKYYDAETQLSYYGKRFYSPNWRIWLNRDPIEEDGGLNLYGFCGNNVICSIDPCGHTVIINMNSTPSRKDNIKNTAGKILNVRGMTRMRGGIKFSCDKCILRAKGVIQLWIELLNESDERWNTRFKRYAQNSQVREDENALSHEMDHFNTWKAFLEFVRTANSIDGKRFNDCADKAKKLNALYGQYKEKARLHSEKFDQAGWNQGGQYSRHPLDTSTFKWE